MAPIDTSGTTTELVSVENEATRGKLERLRMVMEQNRARRRAKREAKAIDNTTNVSNSDLILQFLFPQFDVFQDGVMN